MKRMNENVGDATYLSSLTTSYEAYHVMQHI